jgi:riboflavin transporter FmnP
MKLSSIVKIAVLSGLATVLMSLRIPLFVPYLTLDVSECPALIAAFALGPIYGAAVVLLKDLLYGLTNFKVDELVGLPLNAVAGLTLVLVASNIYQLNKTKRMAVTSLALGTLAMTLVMIPVNILIWPAFARIFLHSPEMDTKSLTNFVIGTSTPFNLIKGTVVSVLTFLVYKRFSAILKADPELRS